MFEVVQDCVPRLTSGQSQKKKENGFLRDGSIDTYSTSFSF